MNDRSNEALLARRAKAEAATPGKWQQCTAYRVFGVSGKNVPAVTTDDDIFMVAEPLENAANDAAHIAANSPDVITADIDEILRLRSLVKEHEEYIANLELESQSIDKKIGEIAAILGITPDAGNMRIPGYIKDEILRLQAEVARLDREAGWLAQEVSNGEHGELDGTSYHIREVPELREQARKAVEGQCKK